MSLYGILQTSSSGMSAQSDLLGTVSDNIANASTNGYKGSDIEFSSFLLNSGASDYQSGSVVANVRHEVTDQGAFNYTSSPTDLAIQGNGFFVVQDSSGQPLLTRAGSFVQNGSGNLVNAAGYELLGYPTSTASLTGLQPVNGYAGLQPINIGALSLKAQPSTNGTLYLNLPSNDHIAATANVHMAGTLDPTLAVNSSYSSTVNVEDSTGNATTLAVAFTKTANGGGSNTWSYSITSPELTTPITGSVSFTNATGAYTPSAPSPISVVLNGSPSPISLDISALTQPIGGSDSVTGTATPNLPSGNVTSSGTTHKTSVVTYDDLGNQVTLDVYTTKTAANTWEATVFDSSKASTGVNAPFPYASGPLTTATLNFSGTNGALTSTSPSPIAVSIPGGATMKLDMSQSSQLAANYSVISSSVNGNAPSNVSNISISSSGVLSAVYANGSSVPAFNIPLATVVSPDNLTTVAGNAYSTNLNSGNVQIGSAGTAGLGTMVSSALEKSTVDLSSELTTMIQTQASYTANSKVFSTAAQLLDVLVNLRS